MADTFRELTGVSACLKPLLCSPQGSKTSEKFELMALELCGVI